MATVAVATGQLIAGRYRLREQFGHGGTAVVYRAYDEQLERDVALKLVDTDAATDGSFSSTLIREARAAAALPDPHIVTVFDAAEHEGRPFIAMELLEGGDLRALLQRHRALDSAYAARLAYGIAQGLAAIHHRGLVHCDVKPRNVLLTRDGEPKLVDFGIACAAATTGSLGREEVVGSAPYLSPEQVRSDPVDARTDVYALGVVLYELLTGQAPFAGSSVAEVAARRLHSVPRPIGELVDGVPPGLVELVARAMSLDPSRRFRDGGEMARALGPFAEGVDSAIPGSASGGEFHVQTTQVFRRPARARPIFGAVAHRAWKPLRAALSGAAARPRVLLTALALCVLALMLVVLFRSYRAEALVVPSVSGIRSDEALQRLQEAGLRATTADEPVTLDTPRGVVVTQEPPAGSTTAKGSEVRLVVSAGVRVPQLIGQQWDDVNPWLDEHGWSLGRVRFVIADRRDFGKVVAQEPPPDSGPLPDKRSTPIDLNIAGPPEATRTGFPAPTSQSSPPAPSQPAAPPAPQRQPAGKPEKKSDRG